MDAHDRRFRCRRPEMGSYASRHEEMEVVPRETTCRSTASAGAIQSYASDLSNFQHGCSFSWMASFSAVGFSPRSRRRYTPYRLLCPRAKIFAWQVRYLVGYGLG